MKNSFAPIFTKILYSSIWMEDYAVRTLWIALLALQDSDHVVRFDSFGLSRLANMPEEEVLRCLSVLSNPDHRRSTTQPHDGRRIIKVEDGWLVVNGQRYEDEMRLVSRRMYQARKQREYRERQRAAETKIVKAKGLGPGSMETIECQIQASQAREAQPY